MPRAEIDVRTLALPTRLAAALVPMTLRTLGFESTGPSNALVLNALTTLFAGHPGFGDLMDIREDDLWDVFRQAGSGAIPGPRLRALIRILEKVEPTTPVCSNCGDMSLADQGGIVRTLEPGSACPHCRKGYLELVPMVLGRLHWVTGEIRESSVSTDYCTMRGTMIPLDDDRIRDWVTRVDLTLADYCERMDVPLYGVLGLMNLKRRKFGHPEEAEAFLEHPVQYHIVSNADFENLMRDTRLFLDERELTNMPHRQFLSSGRARADYWPLVVNGRKFLVEGLVAQGSKCDVFRGVWDKDPTEQVIIKILVSFADKDLLDAEVRNVKLLARVSEPGSEVVKDTIPILVTSGMAELPGGVRRYAVVYRYQQGRDWTLANVMEAYPRGVSGRTLVWMFNRLLLQMSWWHDSGLIHGAILPEHLLIHPLDHTLNVVGWDSALRRGQVQRVAVRGRSDFYPPEVLDGQRVGEHTDIAMACRTMIAVAGGNPLTGGKIPSRIDPSIADLLVTNARYEGNKSVLGRVSAMDLYTAMKIAARSLYGPREYHPLHMWPTREQVFAEERS